MNEGLSIAFFGSSLVSAYWNGAATYYRGIIKALASRGHQITFYEPDIYDRQKHRDIDFPSWAKVVVYPGHDERTLWPLLEEASAADLLIKASGVGEFDELLESAVVQAKSSKTRVVFWDVDAPATLERVTNNPADPFRALIPKYDLILTYGGGEPVVGAYKDLGARQCEVIYNALDPETHHPAERDDRFRADLGLLANRLPDREARIEEFFFKVAAQAPKLRFLLGGNGWQSKLAPWNVTCLGHVYTKDHNSFNCSVKAVLNVNRESMVRFGFSPPTRVFEAAGAAACLICDDWEGIESFLEPGHEVLMARNGEEVLQHLTELTPERAQAIGTAAYQRVMSQHTYRHRAEQLERVLECEARREEVSTAMKQKDGGMAQQLHIVIFGLTVTSSWGNGHATTYRGLLRGMAELGHRVTFFERDQPWYANNRDLPKPPYARVRVYESVKEVQKKFSKEVRNADVVIVGSYVPQGIELGRWVTSIAEGVTAFYDIDTPVTVAKLASGECDYLSRELVPRYDLYLSFTGGPILDDLEQLYHAKRARPLYCSVDPSLYAPCNAKLRWDLGYMGTYSSDRQEGLEKFLLGPARRWSDAKMVVAGPQYPRGIRWPANVARILHLPPNRHARFYASQRYTLNITRAQMRDAGFSPSVRLFEAGACGTPIVTDSWNGLHQFFEPGVEILLAHSSEDVLSFLKDIPESKRMEIGANARAKILRQHTGLHRAQELERYAREVQRISASPCAEVVAPSSGALQLRQSAS